MIQGSKTSGTTNKDLAARAEWSLTDSLWAAQKHITYSLWQAAEARGPGRDKHTIWRTMSNIVETRWHAARLM